MSIRVLQLTDLHVFADPQTGLYGIPTRETLSDVLALIQSRGEQFDHMVITGDHTHDELPESYQALRRMLDPWWDRIHMVPGNHDDRSLIREIFADRVPTTAAEFITFSIDAGAWRIIGLDSHRPGEVSGAVSDEQVEWLKGQLDAHGDGPVAIFMHHPPIQVGSPWLDALMLQDADRLLEVLSSSPQIQVVSCGHVHHEFEGQFGEAKVLATPSTGVQFDPTADEPCSSADAPGYRVFEFGATRMSSHVIRTPEVRFVPDPNA